MRRLLAILAVSGPLAACAKATNANEIVGGVTGDAGTRDGRDFPEPDASLIDAPANQVTLSHNTSNTITSGNSFVCRDSTTKTSKVNKYYRLFQPSAFGVTSTLHVTQVSFGVQLAAAGKGVTSQPATVKLGTYNGAVTRDTLDGRITELASTDFQIPNGEGLTMPVPINGDVKPDEQLVVELDIPDGGGTRKFVIGSNDQGERGEAYTSAPDCGFVSPTTISSIALDNGFGEVDILLSVTGTF